MAGKKKSGGSLLSQLGVVVLLADLPRLGWVGQGKAALPQFGNGNVKAGTGEIRNAQLVGQA